LTVDGVKYRRGRGLKKVREHGLIPQFVRLNSSTTAPPEVIFYDKAGFGTRAPS
jgi:hypothetical protein